MSKKALINIDYTYDFVKGSLPAGETAEQIHDKVVELTQTFIDNDDYVLFAIDLHEENDLHHPETKLFPPHNIKDTEGRKLFGQLQQVFDKNQNKDNVHYLDKTRYSAFAGTDLDIRLRARGITELHFVGVATECCVLHTLVDAYNRGYKLIVHRDAVASFSPEGHNWALQHFSSSLGATIL